ncbi:ATP-binding protein [Actomonas aquatica]|uniref:histidine kinase n=1 Tax=Actomonas aquatica TaxID=2866162 RepID=A0ABZ1C7X0_9BACT|nr:ATP-binding protein [Opitutus sp. WL0086]WRQ87730.1 ATP-binding protein [Opitutus sp. WL0086]
MTTSPPIARRGSAVALLAVFLLAGILVQPIRAQTQAIPAAPAGFLETGVPPFTVLGREALGLRELPSDLHQMPDGRLLIVTPSQIALGDGARWEVFSRSEQDKGLSPLAGVMVASDGRIYAGMEGGFGEVVFLPDGRWSLQQQAAWPTGLPNRIPVPRRCVDVDGTWFWHSESGYVIRWNPGTAAAVVARASTIEAIFAYDGHYYVSDRVVGHLYRIENDGTVTNVDGRSQITPDDAITCTAPFDDKLLVGTYAKGMFLYDGESLTPFVEHSLLGGRSRVVDLHALPGGHYVAALDGFGLVHFDRNGRVRGVFDRSRDPRIARIRHIVPTPSGTFWALLSQGIAQVTLPSSYTSFESLLPAGATSISLHRLDHKLWLLADGKVLRGDYSPENRLRGFTETAAELGFSFSLTTITGEVVIGTDNGIYALREGTWQLVEASIINFRIVNGPSRNGRWLYTADREIGWIRRMADGSYTFERQAVPDFLSSFDSLVDADGVAWLELGAGQLGRLEALPDGQLNLQRLGAEQGVPDAWAQAYLIDDRVAFNISDRLYRYDEVRQLLVPAEEHRRQLSGMRYVVGRPVRDALGRLWVAGDERIHVFNTTTDPWTEVPVDLPDGLRPYYLTPESDGVMWIHSGIQFLRFDPQLTPPSPSDRSALITRVILPNSDLELYNPADTLGSLPYAENSLTIHFAYPDTRLTPPATFEARLSTQDEWSAFGPGGSATFNRLGEGSYHFEVRARRGDEISAADSLDFRILPPWYRSNLAYLSYGIAALALISLAVWSSTLLERRENQRLERLVKQRTAELKESNEQLEEQVEEIRILSQAINQSPVSVLITQVDGTILFVNPRACELSGLREIDLLGRLASSLRQPFDEDDDTVSAEIEACLAEGRTWTGELTNRHADGRLVHVRSSISPIRTAEDKVRFHLILEEDITAWLVEQERHRRLEDQLFQARKLESIGTLAGGIAHDFNNILTGILGNCEIALLDLPEDSPLAADLRDIRKSGLRARDLVSQILTFSRKADSKLVPTDLVAPVSEALKLVRASTPSFIQIAQSLSPGVVLADATQIHQIVLNLCTNAAHAIDGKSGHISVELKPIDIDDELSVEVPELRPGRYMVLIVADDGAGMDAATLERIFDPFFTTKDQGKGTGLGLSTVQGILASHHGTHRVRSTPGVGTTFELYFPITNASSVKTQRAPAESIAEGHSREVLVVDDEESVVQFVATRLTQFGYAPQVHEDPRAALKAYDEAPDRYAALVTDLTMPHLTGADLVQRLRERGSTIPAIVITGYGRENALEKLHTLSNTYVLGKPFSGEELARLLGRALRGDSTPPV